MSTRAAVRNKSGDPTPHHAARAHRPVQVHDDQLGWADLEAMREDFELEGELAIAVSRMWLPLHGLEPPPLSGTCSRPATSRYSRLASALSRQKAQ